MISAKNQNGFVLSFSVLMMGLFILVFAQLQAEQEYALHANDSITWQKTIPLRFMSDAMGDLNTLVDERLRVDQNSTNVSVFVSGTLPSVLSTQTNLTRYQSALFSLGRDANLSVSADWNSTITDGNITGHTDTGFTWKKKLTGGQILFYPTNSISTPRRMDLNIYASLPYTSTSPWILPGTGDMFVNVYYRDANTGHDSNFSGWVRAGSLYTYTWTFGSGSTALRLDAGLLAQALSVKLDNNNTTAMTVTYDTKFYLDANTGYTRAGYDLPLTVSGPDGNVSTSTQWVVD